MERPDYCLGTTDLVIIRDNLGKLCRSVMPELMGGHSPEVRVTYAPDGQINLTLDCPWPDISPIERVKYSAMLGSFLLGAGWARHQKTFEANNGPILWPQLGATSLAFTDLDHLVMAANTLADLVHGPRITSPDTSVGRGR